jgi:hypothetical protein
VLQIAERFTLEKQCKVKLKECSTLVNNLVSAMLPSPYATANTVRASHLVDCDDVNINDLLHKHGFKKEKTNFFRAYSSSNFIFHTKEYDLNKKRANFICSYFNNEFLQHGEIIQFFIYEKTAFCVISEYTVSVDVVKFFKFSTFYEELMRKCQLSKFFKIFQKKQNNLIIVRCNDLNTQCICLHLGEHILLITPVIDFEHS